MPQMNVIALDSFVEIGRQSTEPVTSVYNKGETAVVLYTGGSTGIPKGVEMTNEAFSAMGVIYAEMDYQGLRDNDRILLLIPPNHPTSFVHCLVLPWFCGVTQVLQPIYNKNTFAIDLYNAKANVSMAAASHYATLPRSDLPNGALSNLHLPYCGGEAVALELAESIRAY